VRAGNYQNVGTVNWWACHEAPSSTIKPAAFPAAAGEPRQTAAAVVIHNPGGVCVLFQRRRGPRFNIATIREQAMRNRKAAEVNADVEARIAQIEQMTLDQIGVFQCRILTEITKGRIAPREASALDRALRKRLKAIEQQLREGG
jgi:hypothetical protein